MKKRYIGIILVIALWISLTVFAWGKPAAAASDSERRPLAQMPEFNGKTVLSGSFMRDFADYAVDQFPLRDEFRELKALYSYYVLGQKDNNGIYLHDGYATKMEYPLNETSLAYAADRFNALYRSYLRDSEGRIYFAAVPDKSYYLAEDAGVLSMDYAHLFETMAAAMPWAKPIDLTGSLELGDYYRTDTHWRQERLSEVVQTLSEEMGFEMPEKIGEKPVSEHFYGVYAGQAAMPLKADTLTCITFPGWEDVKVFSADTGKTMGLYDLDKVDSRDPYEMYLSGNMAVQKLTNPHADPGKKLIVFRDSFGASLAPWLSASYGEITLIDTRYVAPAALSKLVKFEGQDVLFLYSTLVLNSSGTLRK